MSKAPAECHPHYLGSAIYSYNVYASITQTQMYVQNPYHLNPRQGSYFLLKSIYTQVKQVTIDSTGRKVKILTCQLGILVIQFLWPTVSSSEKKDNVLYCIQLEVITSVEKTQNLYKANAKYFWYNYLECWLLRKYLIIWQNSISIVWELINVGWTKCMTKRSLKKTQLPIFNPLSIMPTFHNQNIR